MRETARWVRSRVQTGRRPHPPEDALPSPTTRRGVLRGLLAAGAALLAPPAVLTSAVTAAGSAARAARDPAAGIGIAAGGGLPWLDDAGLARELDLVRSTGAGWLRLDVDWSHVERDRDHLDWASTDRAVDAALERGLRLLGLLTYAPRWAQAEPGSGAHPAPADPADFAAFAGAAARRYAGRVDAWEVWNEPNLPQFWSPRPDADAYAALLRSTTAALRAAAPGATVIAGGLAPADDDGERISPVTFVRRLYASGAAQAVDALAVHPYSYPALPGDLTTAAWNTFQRLWLVRAEALLHGDGGKRVWLTEFGAPTGSGDRAVSPRRQATIISDGLARAAAQDWIGPVFVYSARDAGTDPLDPEQNFGLVRSDFTAKPALHVVRRATRAHRRSA